MDYSQNKVSYIPYTFTLKGLNENVNLLLISVIGPQVHKNIGFSIKDVESHIDQCQVPLSIIMLFI